ncbi:unnamed protein product [Natator depressus]
MQLFLGCSCLRLAVPRVIGKGEERKLQQEILPPGPYATNQESDFKKTQANRKRENFSQLDHVHRNERFQGKSKVAHVPEQPKSAEKLHFRGSPSLAHKEC